MATLKTDARAANFDALRLSQAITGNLTLYAASATGYTLLATITASWFPQIEEDRIDGTQFLAVRVVETDANLALITGAINERIAAVGFMSKRYKVRAKHDPLEDPRLWKFQCDPTGEAV